MQGMKINTKITFYFR